MPNFKLLLYLPTLLLLLLLLIFPFFQTGNAAPISKLPPNLVQTWRVDHKGHLITTFHQLRSKPHAYNNGDDIWW